MAEFVMKDMLTKAGRADIDRDVADPWYTGDFEATYSDVVAGCAALLEKLAEHEELKGQSSCKKER